MRKQVNFLSRAALFVSCLFGLIIHSSSNAFAQSVFRVEGVGVEATPTEYNGVCPAPIKFPGKIQANGAGRVKYTWLRSDGATAPVEYVDFEKPGIKYVTTTWTLGDASLLPHYDGWQQIKILSPNEMLSNQAAFKLTCRQSGGIADKKPDLMIEWAKLRIGTVCGPRTAVLYATVKVKNIGTDTSPARSDVGLVGAMDVTGSGWGNGVGLPRLLPGASYTATIPIYYLIDNPTYMLGRHEFEMQVNSGSWIEELNTSNNRYGPVAIEIPTGFCAPK